MPIKFEAGRAVADELLTRCTLPHTPPEQEEGEDSVSGQDSDIPEASTSATAGLAVSSAKARPNAGSSQQHGEVLVAG
jgi:hypothetical protein